MGDGGCTSHPTSSATGWGPLSRDDPRELGIVLLESPAEAARPYHRQKLALLLANQRHFALEQAGRGGAVHYAVAERSYAAALRGGETRAWNRPGDYR